MKTYYKNRRMWHIYKKRLRTFKKIIGTMKLKTA